MSTKEPKIDLELDNNLNGILLITCTECKRKIKKKFKELSPNKEVTCTCGKLSATFTGDDLRKTQKSLDDLKKTLQIFGR